MTGSDAAKPPDTNQTPQPNTLEQRGKPRRRNRFAQNPPKPTPATPQRQTAPNSEKDLAMKRLR
jgi:hypothetical protein